MYEVVTMKWINIMSNNESVIYDIKIENTSLILDVKLWNEELKI